MKHRPIKNYTFETGMYRPPSEGGSASLLLRLTRNCPWNHCTFCGMYKSEKFELRKPGDIIQDINTMHDIYLELKDLSGQSNQEGLISRSAFQAFIDKTPELYFHQGLSMLFNWLASGGQTVFLQDADSLIMKTDHMIQVLTYLKKTFPSIERITSYGRSRTIVRKPFTDLERIHKAGLDRLHIGLETGDEKLLKTIKKGTTPEDHVKGGQKAIKAGFQVSEYWMPGLGGKLLSCDHAVNTARVLNQINPHYIRSRPFTPRPGTIFFDNASAGRTARMTSAEQLMEIKTTIDALTVSSRICFDHAGNYWKATDGSFLFHQGYEGYKFPEEKQTVLELIKNGIAQYKK